MINDKIVQILITIMTSKPFCDALIQLFDFYRDKMKKAVFVIKIESILQPKKQGM